MLTRQLHDLHATGAMVRLTGLEPVRLLARDFKSLASTYFATTAKTLL